MNTKSLIATVVGVLMVGATTVGAGMALAEDEPGLVESDPVAVRSPGDVAESEYDDGDLEAYEEPDEYEGYEDEEYEDDEHEQDRYQDEECGEGEGDDV